VGGRRAAPVGQKGPESGAVVRPVAAVRGRPIGKEARRSARDRRGERAGRPARRARLGAQRGRCAAARRPQQRPRRGWGGPVRGQRQGDRPQGRRRLCPRARTGAGGSLRADARPRRGSAPRRRRRARARAGCPPRRPPPATATRSVSRIGICLVVVGAGDMWESAPARLARAHGRLWMPCGQVGEDAAPRRALSTACPQGIHRFVHSSVNRWLCSCTLRRGAARPGRSAPRGAPLGRRRAQRQGPGGGHADLSD